MLASRKDAVEIDEACIKTHWRSHMATFILIWCKGGLFYRNEHELHKVEEIKI